MEDLNRGDLVIHIINNREYFICKDSNDNYDINYKDLRIRKVYDEDGNFLHD